jgi:DNA-binding transcriptional LysR family regulator
MEWENLRFVLAVADAGSVAHAARTVGVNHSTILRRLAAFERTLGLRLFERLPGGYIPTAGCEELIATARSMDDMVTSLERRLAGRDLRLPGKIRLTTTDTLMASVFPEILADFRSAYPDIDIEIAVSNEIFNLRKRDADVAIRPAPNPPESLVGRRVTKIAFAIYGNREKYPAGRWAGDLAALAWVGVDDNLAESSIARWMRATLPRNIASVRVNSLLALKLAAEASLGVAALPCYLGDASPTLVRMHSPIAAMETALWILTHRDLRDVARVRAFTRFVASAFVEHRALFEGNRPSGLRS